MEYRNAVICGDCLDVMKQLERDSIACCITDPPYNYEFIGREWDETEIRRRLERVKDSKSTLVKHIPYGSGLAGGVRNPRWYDRNRQNLLDYQSWAEQWGRELLRVLKPGGLALVFNGSRTAAHIQVALEHAGFYARDILVWRRNSGITKGLNVSKKLEKMGDVHAQEWSGWHSCLRSGWEAIVVVQKPLMNNYIETLTRFHVGLFQARDDNGFQSNIIEPIQKEGLDDFNTHPTVKPLKLMEKLVKLTVPKGYGNIVMDPFAGSGTTLLAAQNLGIDYLGIEINPEYAQISKKRLQKAQIP